MKLNKNSRWHDGLQSYHWLGAALLIAAQAAAQLPEPCKAPTELATAIRATPSASVYDAAGAWFAGRRDLQCALAAFSKAVEIEPGSAEAHYNLGLADAGLKHVIEADNQFRLALKIDPNMTLAHNSLGFLLLDSDHAADAEVQFREALKADPNSVSALDHVGLALVAQRRYSAAIGYWKQALALQPDSSEIELSMAAATYEDGDKKGAIAMLNSLISAHPDNKEAHFTLGNIYAKEMRFGEAATEYGQVLRLDPSDNVALLARAKALSSSGSYQDASAPGEEYVHRKPADPEGHVVLGSIYKTLGDYDKAEVELKQAVAAQPNNAQAQYELGFVLARNQKAQQALPHLEKSYALNPSDTSTQFQLAGVLRKLGDTKRASEITEVFKTDKEKERQLSQVTVNGGQANVYLQSGEPARAAEVYRQLLVIDPRNARTEYNLALALAATHDLRGEREALEKAVEFDPKMAVAQSELGLMDIAAGNLVEAQRRLEAALAIDPQLAGAQGNLGLIYAIKGDNATAEKMFRKSIEDDPNYVQGYLNLGLTLASQQNFAEAEIQLEHAMALAPNNARVVATLGKVKSRLGKNEEATTLLRKNVTLVPGSVDAHLDLAISLADGYDLKGALSEADAAIQLDAHSAAAHFNRGRILFDLGRSSDAKASLEMACRLAPSMPDAHYYLALVDKQLGSYEESAALLQEVVRSQPGNVMAWNFLGQSLHAQSKENDAITAWRRAIALDPQYTPALYSLSRALLSVDRAESDRVAAQLKAVLQERHIVDEAQTVANNAIASTQAHDWPEAVKGLKEAIQICGECSAKPDLHKSLGLIYCHAGDLDNGERELRLAESLKGDDADIKRALALLASARAQPAGRGEPGQQ